MSIGWLIPGSTTDPQVSEQAVEDAHNDLFGHDLFWQGRLQVTQSGDYAEVSGLTNLRQAVYRRLITRPGDFRFRPDYGVGVQTYVKKQDNQANRDALRNRIVEQLLQDRRITKVDVTIESVTINGLAAIKVYVRVTAAGESRAFEPFTFSEEAS